MSRPTEEDCLVWTGTVDRHGYGRMTVGSRAGESMRSTRFVHRISFELAYGEIPPGLEIDHVCGNRLCVRPEHLQAVTREEHARRESERRNRWARVEAAPAPVHGSYLLDLIYELRIGSMLSATAIAKQLGISAPYAARLVRRIDPENFGREPARDREKLPLIRHLRAQGLGYKAIARELGCNRDRARRLVRIAEAVH